MKFKKFLFNVAMWFGLVLIFCGAFAAGQGDEVIGGIIAGLGLCLSYIGFSKLF